MARQMWWTGVVICAVCDKSHAAVCPITVDHNEDWEPPTGLECPYCHSMSCVPVQDVEEGDEY